MSGSVTTAKVLRLIDAIYAAALDENRWKDVLRDTCSLAGSTIGSLDWKDLRSGQAAAPCAVGVSPEWEEKYAAHFGLVNPFQPRILRRFGSGDVIDGNDVVAWDELRGTEYFNDFLARIGCSTAGGICLFVTSEVASFLSILKPRDDRDFTHSQLSILRTLVPHFQRALSIHQRLQQTARERREGLEALDWFAWGLILLDQAERVWFVNREAQRITASNDGLTVRDQRLQTTNVCRRELAAALAVACGRIQSAQTETGAGVIVERPSGLRAYYVTVIPHSAQTLDAVGLPSPGSGALVMISDPESRQQLPVDALRRLFALTPAEAALAASMCRGTALSDYADGAGIATGTARKLLNQLFMKTGTHRQGELVSLLLHSLIGRTRNERV